jgi:Cu/Ag efflux protein CusF
VNNVYGCDATGGKITLTLSNGTTAGEYLEVKKLDGSSNRVTINASSID